MTDESIAEIYAIAREAFAGGQRGFQFQSYPFRMTAENLAKHRVDPNMPFWKNLKEGSDYFEALKEEPKVAVCGQRYVFGGSDVAQGSCSPRLDPAVVEKREADESQVAALIAKGAPAVRTVYADGGQHQSFREIQVADGGDAGSNFSLFARPQPRRNLGEVSRPEALAQGPQEILMDEPAPKAGKVKPSTALALAAAQKVMAAKSAGTKGAAAKPASSGSAARAPKPDAVVVASAGDDAPVGSVRRTPGSGQPPAAVEPASRHKRPDTAQAKPASKPGVTTVPKPDAVFAGPERRAEAPGGLIQGAQPVLPSAAGFARAN
jgi:hypothetical protein